MILNRLHAYSISAFLSDHRYSTEHC